MITMRRKITEEKDRYGSFDSVIEVDGVKGKSYNANQRETAETVNYSSRRQAMSGAAANSTAAKRKSGEFMPQIKNERVQKERSTEVIGLKTKMLLITYVAVAVILAAVVIGTGVAITNASNKANGLEQSLATQKQIVTEQAAHLTVLSDENAITGNAVNNLNMDKVTDYIEITLVDVVEPVTYQASTNWFDKFCRFVASIF